LSVASETPCSASRAPSEPDRPVGERNHPDEPLVPIEHRKSPHLVLGHYLAGSFRIIIFETIADALRHHLANRCIAGGAILGSRPYDDIAVSHHPNQPVILANRQGADIAGAHLPSDLADCHVRIGDFDVALHNFTNLHCSLS